MSEQKHTFRVYGAEDKTLALVELSCGPDKVELLQSQMLEILTEFYPDWQGYSYVGPSDKEKKCPVNLWY